MKVDRRAVEPKLEHHPDRTVEPSQAHEQLALAAAMAKPKAERGADPRRRPSAATDEVERSLLPSTETAAAIATAAPLKCASLESPPQAHEPQDPRRRGPPASAEPAIQGDDAPRDPRKQAVVTRALAAKPSAAVLAPPSPAELLAALQAAFAAPNPQAAKLATTFSAVEPFPPLVPSPSSASSCGVASKGVFAGAPQMAAHMAAQTVPLMLPPQMPPPWGLPGAVPQVPQQPPLTQLLPPPRIPDIGIATAAAAQSAAHQSILWMAAAQGAAVEKLVEPAAQETQRRLAAYSNLLLGAAGGEGGAGTEQPGDDAPWRSRKRRRATTANGASATGEATL